MAKRGNTHAMSMLEKQQRAKAKAIERTEKILTSIYTKGPDRTATLFYQTVHEFFSDFCNLHYQFTYTELMRDIKRKKLFEEFLIGKVLDFINRLQEKEFSNTEYTTDELMHLTDDFKAIVSASNSVQDTMLNKGLNTGGKISLWMHGLRTKWRKNDIQLIIGLQSAANQALKENNYEKSQAIYNEIDKIYQKLSSEEKKAVYSSIKGLFNSIAAGIGNELLQSAEQE